MKETHVRNAFLLQDTAVLVAVFAIGLVFSLMGEGWNGLGILIILSGAMMLPFYHHGYRLDGKKGMFCLKEISLSREYRDDILAFLSGEKDSLKLDSGQKGGALVDVYRRKSDGLLMARYFDYADFMNGVEYPLTEISPKQLSELEKYSTDKK